MIGQVYDRFLDKHESFPEKPAGQLVFDLKYALTILSRDNEGKPDEAFLARATSLLDPIDWSFLEEHVNVQVATVSQRTSLLLSSPPPPSKTGSAKLKLLSRQSSNNPVNRT